MKTLPIAVKLIIAFTFLTSAINAQVAQDWVARFDGIAHTTDNANSIAVDAAGNVYVTGESEVNGIRRDFVTIKYNSSGVQQWMARYNGPGNHIDQAYDIAVDDLGNVYVTGGSRGIGTERDFCTIKYNSDGDSVWVRRYNGPDNNIDESIAVEVDGLGNVYVTGYSDGGVNLDYYTIKYSSSGEVEWASRYDGPATGTGSEDRPHFLAIDGDGNVYVTGESSAGVGFLDLYATVKYLPSGDTAWVARYRGPGNETLSQAYSLAVDDGGNVYVTGRSDPNSGFGFNFDIVTIMYDPFGDQLWAHRFNGTGNSSDVGYTLALDHEGNILVGGLTVETTADYCAIKYNPSGQILWVATYNGPGNSIDDASSIAVDASNNVYVTGYSTGVGTGTDYATIKYDPSGSQQWVQRYNGPANSADQPSVLVLDGSGNVFVTGESNGTGSGLDYATIKYSQTTGIPCSDFTDFHAVCGSNGNIGARVILDNPDHAGENVEFIIDGDLHTATVMNRGDLSRAQVVVSGYGPGEHTVMLVDPPGCFDPIVLNCTGIADATEAGWPDAGEIYQLTSMLGNYPNPFNPVTTISYLLSQDARVTLKIYSALGEEVATLVSGHVKAGIHSVEWDASDQPSGVYFYRLNSDGIVQTRKLLLLK